MLDGQPDEPYQPEPTAHLLPREITGGVWASDLDGARGSDADFAVISLCRTGCRFEHHVQRFAYLADNGDNHDLATVLEDILADIAGLRADGQRVLVHCHGGASRTGLVLRAWVMRQQGLGAEEATDYVRTRWPHLGLWNPTFDDALRQLVGPSG